MENSLVKKQRSHLLDLLEEAKKEYNLNKSKQDWEKAAKWADIHSHIGKELYKLIGGDYISYTDSGFLKDDGGDSEAYWKPGAEELVFINI